MSSRTISATGLIQAPPAAVYAVIADYRDGHPRIIPRPPFVSLEVEEGGVGAGTTIRVGMRVLGATQHYRAVVTEPEPGRVLVEAGDSGYVTSFTVDPDDDARRSRVTIATALPQRGALAGAVERWFMGRLLPPVFRREMELLEEVARSRG